MNDSLRDKLAGSDTLKSLRDETAIAESLSQLGWKATVGPTYDDIITGKLREIDVRARRGWLTQSKPRLHASVIVFCESKTMNGFHLVFADSPAKTPSRLISMAHTVWAGYEDRENQARVADVLVRAGLEQDTSDRVVGSLTTISHPEGIAAVSQLMISPFEGPMPATTFKETAIKTEKELDNSVLWRACQALASVMTSYKNSFHTATEEDLEFVARHGILNNTLMEAFADAYARRVSLLVMFHPVVVVDATLWMVRGEELAQVPSCRFVQRSATDETVTWYDVVSRGEFNAYAKDMNEYYEKRLSQAGCTPVADTDDILDGIPSE